jgi:catechol 2,3-dioxygenase-like lactoylglutathione lyase family enzyme
MTERHQTLWLFHATAMVPDYDAAFAALDRLVGLRVVYEVNAAQAGAGYRGGAVWIGDNSLELGEPIEADSPVDRFVRQQGGGVHSLCVSVPNVEATIAHFDAHRVRHTPVFPPGFFFGDPRDTGGVLLEVEIAGGPPEGGNSRRRLGHPRAGEPPLLDVDELAFMGALAEDPVTLANRIADLLGTDVTFENSGAGPTEPTAAVSMVDNTLALFSLPGKISRQLWGRVYHRPRMHVIGLRVPDLEAAAARLTDAKVRLVRADDTAIIIDPAATGEVALTIVDRLLPGDPRTI